MVTNKVKLNEIVNLWLQNKKQFVKESTYATYRMIIKNHVNSFFEDKVNITEEELQEFVLKKLDGNLSEKTVKDIVIVIKMVLNFSIKRNFIDRYNFDITFPARSKKNIVEVLSKNDQKKLMNYLKSNFTFKNLGIIICLSTGLRIGELCALTWGDIDLSNGILKINKTIQRIYDIESDFKRTKLIIDEPKTKESNREIPLSNDIMKIVKPIIKLLNSDYYILSNDIKPLEPRTYRNYFKNILDILNIKYIKFHGLRHTFATRCIESNADCKTVSVILGHANINTTLNLYVHPNNDQKR